jgi:hypothetical protein
MEVEPVGEILDRLSNEVSSIACDFPSKWILFTEKEIIDYINLIPDREQAILTFVEWLLRQNPQYRFSSRLWPFRFSPLEIKYCLIRLVLTYVFLINLIECIWRI